MLSVQQLKALGPHGYEILQARINHEVANNKEIQKILRGVVKENVVVLSSEKVAPEKPLAKKK